MLKSGLNSLKKREAFSLVEILIALIIIAIAGGTALTVLWGVVNSNSQMSDYTFTDAEIENAIQSLSRDFALIGLGMPNNRNGEGSFALSFRDATNVDQWPIMAFFGKADEPWGGPVTVAGATPSYPTDRTGSLTFPDIHEDAYLGPELYYAWSVPTGARVDVTNPGGGRKVINGTGLQLVFHDDPPKEFPKDIQNRNLTWQSPRAAGVPSPLSNIGRDTRTWMTLPTLRLPLRAERWDRNVLDVTAAPTATDMSRTMMEVDEVHVMQAARLYRRGNELVKVIFEADYTKETGRFEEVLAANVVGLQFTYDPNDGLLTMYIAVRGQERSLAGTAGQTGGWPDFLPDIVPGDAAGFRVMTKTVTWLIRN